MTFHADLARAREIFRGLDLSEVQNLLLQSCIVRDREQAADKLSVDFENQLFVHRPEWYQQLQDLKKQKSQKEDNFGLDVEWRIPDTLEEAEAIAREFAELDRVHKSGMTPETGTDESDTLDFLDDFDLDELGDL